MSVLSGYLQSNFANDIKNKNTLGRESFKFDILKCLDLVDLNNPWILMTHGKMAVAANIGP